MTEVIAFLAFCCAVVALFVAVDVRDNLRDVAAEIDEQMSKLGDDIELAARSVDHLIDILAAEIDEQVSKLSDDVDKLSDDVEMVARKVVHK